MGVDERARRPIPGSSPITIPAPACARLGVKAQPRALLRTVAGLELRELAEPEVCCGFGGTFCVKYPDISTRMVSDKAADVIATGADTLLAGDMGCLLNMAGRLTRLGSSRAGAARRRGARRHDRRGAADRAARTTLAALTGIGFATRD